MGLDTLVVNGVGFCAEVVQHQRNKKKDKLKSITAPTVTTSYLETTNPSHPVAEVPTHLENRQTYLSPRTSGELVMARGSSESPDGKSSSPDCAEEELWELDEAARRDGHAGVTSQQRAVIPKGVGKDPARISKLVEAFISVYRPTPLGEPAHLPQAVIIPQRRPESRDRGFVRAYAPSLASCGISEDAFMQFHDFYDESLKYSNAIKVISVASTIAGFAPSPTAFLVTTAVTAAATAAGSMQSRYRSNDFLTRMNAEYFMPRGLICLVMKYNQADSDEDSVQQLQATSLDDAMAKAQERRRWNFGTNHGGMDEESMPMAAPLVFPELDRVTEEEKGNRFQRTTRFVQGYMDRRAQAEFSKKSPDSQLSKAVDGHIKFESWLADPRKISGFSRSQQNTSGGDHRRHHESESGRDYRLERRSERSRGPVGMVLSLAKQAASSRSSSSTSSAPNPPAPYGGSSDSYFGSSSFSNPPAPYGGSSSSRDSDEGRRDGRRSERSGGGGLLGQFTQKHVLYMMIVPLPRQEEINAAMDDPPAYLEMEEVRI